MRLSSVERLLVILVDEPRDKDGLTEAEFLAAYDASKYERPSVTVDIVLILADVLTLDPDNLEILLIKRGGHPFIGKWALPGGFVNPDETLEQAARRELAEETGIQARNIALQQLHTFSDPQRDPRTRIITCVFGAFEAKQSLFSESAAQRIQAGDDASDLGLFKLDELEKLDLAGDHREIIEFAIASLK